MNKITQAYREGMEELTERAKVPNNLMDIEEGKISALYLRDAQEIFQDFARKLILAAKSSMPEDKRIACSPSHTKTKGGAIEICHQCSVNSGFITARTAALAPLDEFLEAIK